MYDSTARKAHGYVTIISPEEPTQEFDTIRCVHCGGHFRVIPGSGTKRGFCLRCGGATCGKKQCNTCLPFEKWLDKVEKADRMRIKAI